MLDDLTALFDTQSVDPATYQYFDKLMNQRTIIFN